MPAYNVTIGNYTGPGGAGLYAGAIALQPGDSAALVNNAATDSGITSTQQVHISQTPDADTWVHVSNTCNVPCTIKTTTVADVLANYQALTDADTGQAITVANGADASFNPGGCWLIGSFTTAPTSGSLVIAR